MPITGNSTTTKVYSTCDYIPVLSTATSLINLFLKALSYVLPQKFKENSIFAPVKDLSIGRSLILLVPFFGNIIIGVYDNSTRKQAEALYAQAETEKDPAKALVELYKQSAELGHVEAMRKLGEHYEGQGDTKKALEWYDRAIHAGKNDPAILEKTATLLKKRTGELQQEIEQEKSLRIETERKTEELERMLESGQAGPNASEPSLQPEDPQDADGMYRLAFAYKHGNNGVTKDLQKSFEWFEKAAGKGDRIAMFHVATCYKNGEGVGQDLEKAIDWYSKSAEKGHTPAKTAAEKLKQPTTE